MSAHDLVDQLLAGRRMADIHRLGPAGAHVQLGQPVDVHVDGDHNRASLGK